MNNGTVKLRLKQNVQGKKISSAKVAEIAYMHFHVAFNKIAEQHDGYLVITKNTQDADRIMKEDAMDLFHKHGYTTIIPPAFRAKRTIFIRRVDDQIYSNSEEELASELMHQNSWAKVQTLIKLKEKKVLKVIFMDSTMVDKALEAGLLCCNMSITGSQISRETFTEITICYKCYTFNKHLARDCKTPTTSCSECSSPEHMWRECRSTLKKCLNCSGPHATLAPFCPKRRIAIADKRKAEVINNAPRNSYAERTTSGGSTNCTNTAASTSTRPHSNTELKILTCVIMSHVNNMVEPGSFNRYFSKIMVANGLPNVIVPEIADSKRILEALQASTPLPTPETTSPTSRRLFPVETTSAEVNIAPVIDEEPTPLGATAISPQRKKSRAEINNQREAVRMDRENEKREKQARFLQQKEREIASQIKRQRSASASPRMKRTPIKSRHFLNNRDTRQASISALRKDEIQAMDIHYYSTSIITKENFAVVAAEEMLKGKETVKITFLDPFKNFKHPSILDVTETEVQYLFTNKMIPFESVKVFDKLDEGELRRRREGLRSPTK